VSTDQLQKIFKTLSDPTRVRILALLEQEELAVQELMRVLGMAQSRVSRHLAILRDAGLLRDRRDGTFAYYRFPTPQEGAWRDAWELTRHQMIDDPTVERDAAALREVLSARAQRTRSWFDTVGPEWDALRKVFNDDALRARAIAHLAPPGITVCDVGTGTGVLALELARLGVRVVAVDHSPAMLDAARAKLHAAGAGSVELRRGDAADLPLDDASVDAAFAHMVLHYLPSPADALAEMARVVKPGGPVSRVVVVDFEEHDREWMREELGVQWLGFPLEDVRAWLEAAGLEDVRVERTNGSGPGPELPATFIASARRAA
jgi:ArsR family transcriptional regulator